jgi:hypothetical protein
VPEPAKKAQRTRPQQGGRRANVAQKTAKTKPKQGRAASERSRKGREKTRKKTAAYQPRSFDSELFATLKDTPGANLEAISRLTGFSEERVSKLEKLDVIERGTSGGFRIGEGFMKAFRGENLERKTSRREQLDMTEFLMELEARIEVQREQPAGVA